MIRITETVKHLLIINALVFLAFQIPQDFTKYFLLYPPESGRFGVWQLLTSMFSHKGVQHFFFNMMALFFFGPDVERQLGSKRFLTFYLSCGIGAGLAVLLLNYFDLYQMRPSLGASGAIYGLFIAFMLFYPRRKIMLLFPPIPIEARIFVPILLGIDLYAGLTGSQPGIGNFAHLGGALTGFILLKFWKKA